MIYYFAFAIALAVNSIYLGELCLIKQGYRSIGTDDASEFGNFLIHAECPEQSLSFFVDTGAPFSYLTANAATRLKNRSFLPQASRVSQRSKFLLDDFSINPISKRPVEFILLDDEKQSISHLSHRRLDGVIGADILVSHHAVFKYPWGLWLKDDICVHAQKLQGIWKYDGKDHPDSTIEFANDSVKWRDGNRILRGRYKLNPYSNPPAMYIDCNQLDHQNHDTPQQIQLTYTLQNDTIKLLDVNIESIPINMPKSLTSIRKSDRSVWLRVSPRPVQYPQLFEDYCRSAYDVSVPISRSSPDNYLSVKATCRGKTINLLVDTGRWFTTLDSQTARDLNSTLIAPWDENVSIHRLDSFTFANMSTDLDFLLVRDLSTSFEVVKRRDDLILNGLLGIDFLRKHRAVIDYSSLTLYMMKQ